MALVPWPSAAIVESVTASLAFPGRTVVRSQFGAHAQVIDHGIGHWAGSVSIGLEERNSDGHAAIDSFLTEMLADPTSWTVLPWGKIGVYESFYYGLQNVALNVFSSSVAAVNGNLVRLPCPVRVGAADSVPAVGEYLRIAGRTAVIVSATDVAGTGGNLRLCDLQLQPKIPVAVNDDVYRGDAIQIRLPADQQIPLSYSGDGFAGPWAFRWVENF